MPQLWKPAIVLGMAWTLMIGVTAIAKTAVTDTADTPILSRINSGFTNLSEKRSTTTQRRNQSALRVGLNRLASDTIN